MLRLRLPDTEPYRKHPLAVSKVVTIDLTFDAPTDSFVTRVKELHGMSSFGRTRTEALDSTVEMIRGHIRSMEANRKKIPLSARKLTELKRLVGLR